MPVPEKPLLFTPLDLPGVTAKNRIVVSPMCQYAAVDGVATEWHFAHHHRFAVGGAGIGFVEATGLEARGRITPGCTGIWTDVQVPALAEIAKIYRDHGALSGIQLAHAGRKASAQRPWHGSGPLSKADEARGDKAWEVVGPSPEAVSPGWPAPHPLSVGEIRDLVGKWADAARRALAADFDIVEIHGAHGYLIHSFLSPLSNRRDDAYGGDLNRRMRFALEVTEAVRAVWPKDRPLFYRTSAVDGIDGGVTIEDTVALAKALKARGVDVIDCSSGGLRGPATASASRTRPKPGFQVPYAEQVRREAGIKTMAVGLIVDAIQAEEILRHKQADLIALARELLYNPFWPLHAAQVLGTDAEFAAWPEQYGWYLTRRAKALALPEAAD
ncbi:MAG: NADH:flavin oxidoreductase/NADH oxidase [Alphaproteobacteria bacterium]|nr:NADH:flavin oxidoreductase/NADH oxidase [Alphaproteobacteria bacterium]